MDYKRSPKSPVLYERYKSGCAWSLIRFCDFSQGHSNKKLISNRGLNSHLVDDRHIKNRLDLLSNSDKRCQCIEDGVKKTLKEDSLKVDVTRVREEQMATEQQTKKKINISTMKKVPDSNPVGHLGKNHRRKASRGFHMHGCKDISTVVHTQHSHENSLSTSKRFNAAALNETSCNEVHPKSGRDCSCRSVSCQKNDQLSEINLQVQMNEAAEAFINQNIVNGKNHGRDQVSHQSKYFVDALGILNSNKELFIKLLQDPNSLLAKHIQDLRDSQAKQQESAGSFSELKFLEACRSSARGCEGTASTQKSCDRYPSKGSVDSQPSDTIVVLKSGPTCMQNSADELSDCSSPQSLYSMRNKAQGAKPAYFSFEHMKRKLRHAIGLSRKEKSLSSTVTLHKSSRDILGLGDGGKGNDFQIEESNSPYEIYSDISRMEKSSVDVKRREEVRQVKGFEPGARQQVALNSGSVRDNQKLSMVRHLNKRESNTYIDSRKHLSEMFRNRNEVFLRKQLPKPLGRIISMPEYDFSFALSPQKLQEYGFMTGQMRFSPYSNYQMLNEKRQRFQKEKKNIYLDPERQLLEAPSSANNKILTDRLQAFDTKPNISENHFSEIKLQESVPSSNHTASPTGSEEIVEMCNTINMGDISSPGVSLESDDQHNTDANLSAGVANAFEENQYLKCLNLDSSVEKCTSPKNVYSSSPLSVKSLEYSVDMKDKAEHTSPVSVLEQFIEDSTSPPITISQPGRLSAEPAVEPKQINYEEPFSATFTMSPMDQKINSCTHRDEHKSLSKYIRAVLQASGINWDELLMICHSSDQLIESSLFDKLETLPTQFQGDHMLLFDYTNEVLGEVYQSHLSCSPWLSFATQKIHPVKAGTSMVSEVMNCVDWHLLSQQSPLTLEQLMQKDLAKSITWMDIRTDAGDIVTEIVERLLEELTLETATHLIT